MPLLSLRGARHYYRLEGSPTRPFLMLVHPIGADLSLWDKATPHLLEHFRVLRYDLRGHGGSETTPGPYDIELLSDDLLGMASAMGWEQFSVCGVSIGAMTAVKAASKATDRVKSLVVCSATPHMHAPPGGWDARAASARSTGMGPLAGAMAERMFSAPFRETGDPHVETLRTVFLQMDPEGYASSIAVLRDTDLSDTLASVTASTLLATGKYDPLVPPTATAAFKSGIAHSTHVEFDAGHFPPVEAPRHFAEVVAAHILQEAQ